MAVDKRTGRKERSARRLAGKPGTRPSPAIQAALAALFVLLVALPAVRNNFVNLGWLYWVGVEKWAVGTARNVQQAQTYATDVAYLSGGVLDPASVKVSPGSISTWVVSLSPGVPRLLGPAGTPGPAPPSGSQVTAAPVNGPVENLAPLTLSFAPGPAVFSGPCGKQPRSFPYPFDLNGAGQCVALGAVPPGLAQPPQPAP